MNRSRKQKAESVRQEKCSALENCIFVSLLNFFFSFQFLTLPERGLKSSLGDKVDSSNIENKNLKLQK